MDAPEPVAGAATIRPRSRPWWLPRFIGGIPAIEPRLLNLLGLVALALCFEQYDFSMLTAALKFIARDLGMAESDLGTYTAWIRFGALPAFLLIPFADRFGRRRLFLASVVGISIATCLTAFTRTRFQFVVMQMLSHTFMPIGSATAFVIATEEFPAEHRGWGIGMLGALSACGVGLGALLFATIEHLPYGWRTLYAAGIVPLVLLPRFRRGIPETLRFETHRQRRALREAKPSGAAGWLQPLVELASIYPGRACGIAVLGGLMALGANSVFQFIGYFTQTAHAWVPWEFSLMVLCGGGVGIVGNVAAGRLGDVIGRRRTGLLFMSLFPVSAGVFYLGPGWSLPLAFCALVFCATASDVIVRALATESFPTSYRGTASGWLSLVETCGTAAGLAIVGLRTRQPGDLARVVTVLSLAVLVGAGALLLLPETQRRALEAISPEDAE